jgi:putative membrane protein
MFGSSSSEKVLSLVISWLLLALAVWVAAQVVSGIHLIGWQSTLIIAAILGLLNLTLKRVLDLLSLPLIILTLGLFIFVINAALLLLTSKIAEHFSSIHFHVDNFLAAILGAIIITIVSIVVHFFINPDKIARRLTSGV